MRYELLGRHTGLRVSELVLGAGMFGTKWGYGGGLLTSKYRKGGNGRQAAMGGRLFTAEDTGQKTAILDTLEMIADEMDSNPGRVALAWIGSKSVIPIIGPRTRAQLDDNLAACDLPLTADQLRRLDAVSAVPLGFPHDMLATPAYRDRIAGGKRALLDLSVQPVRLP